MMMDDKVFEDFELAKSVFGAIFAAFALNGFLRNHSAWDGIVKDSWDLSDQMVVEFEKRVKIAEERINKERAL